GRVDRRSAALVEPVTSDQAAARRDLEVFGRLDLCGRARDVPDAHLVDVALEEAGRGAVARERAADRGVLGARRLRRERAAERERAIEDAVEIQTPGVSGGVVDRGGVMPDIAGDGRRPAHGVVRAVRAVLEV